jgi:hypothetical protein
MTTTNGHQVETKCIVKFVKQSRNDVHRHLGYMYAGYKYDWEDSVKRGFLFKKDCFLPIDEGFCFDEHEVIEWRESESVGVMPDGSERIFPVKFRVVKPAFYSQEPPIPSDLAAELEESGIHSDFDRLQDILSAAPPQAAAPVVTPVAKTPELWEVFGSDIANLYNLIQKQTNNAGPGECQRMATSAFIALREATNKLSPEQVDKLRKASY